MVAPVPGALLDSSGSLSVAIAGVPHFVLNTMALTAPMSPELLSGNLAAIRQHAARCAAPWLLMTCDEWMFPEAGAMLAPEGLSPAMHLTGMAAPNLSPRRRPAPAALRLETRLDDAMILALFDVNSHAYGMPLELGRESVRPGLFSNAWCAVGYIEDEPVSAAVVYRVGDCLYVAWVATLPGHQGKGYAEAAMRRALEDASAATGLTRTTLHASAAGQPLYTNMGYAAVAGFTFYAFGLGH
jgi:GNAT superfamily N-acetyltransferase